MLAIYYYFVFGGSNIDVRTTRVVLAASRHVCTKYSVTVFSGTSGSCCYRLHAAVASVSNH